MRALGELKDELKASHGFSHLRSPISKCVSCTAGSWRIDNLPVESSVSLLPSTKTEMLSNNICSVYS